MMEPDDYTSDPYGHITNQAGHAYLVGMPFAVMFWPWFGIAAPGFVALAYGLIWEIGVQKGRLWRDSLEDAVHVLCGAGVIVSALSGDFLAVAIAMAAHGALLGVGVWRRK